MTALTLPTQRDEEWRYADFAALETLAPEMFGEWKDVAIAAGETRRKCLIVGSDAPELHRIRIDIGEGINAIMRKPDKGVLLITHYQRLLDYVRPDYVHVLSKGRIVKSGGPELAHQLESEGYEAVTQEMPA